MKIIAVRLNVWAIQFHDKGRHFRNIAQFACFGTKKKFQLATFGGRGEEEECYRGQGLDLYIISVIILGFHIFLWDTVIKNSTEDKKDFFYLVSAFGVLLCFKNVFLIWNWNDLAVFSDIKDVDYEV